MPRKPLVAIALSALSMPGALRAQEPGPVIYTLAVAGDTRLDPTRLKADVTHLDTRDREAYWKDRQRKDDGTYPWTFNYVQVRQTLDDLGALPKDLMPNRLVIMGDLVMGFKQDDGGQSLTRELADFQWAMDRAAASGTAAPLVDVPKIFLPGNHEMTYKAYSASKTTSGVDLGNAKAWATWTRQFHNGEFNGPAKGEPAADGYQLALDQKNETYSFQDAGGRVHVVVINTDTPIQDSKGQFVPDLGRVPLAWLERDLAKAQADPKVQTILVLGHKPAVRPGNFADVKKDDDTLHPAVAGAFADLLRRHSKVAAYICSHAHLFRADSLTGSAQITQRPTQIVVGNGGTSLETWWKPKDELPPFKTEAPYFGYALVQVHATGEVRFRAYGRPAPEGKPIYAKYDTPEAAKAKPVMEWQVIKKP